MGHVRLGILPKTKRWKNVISLISDGADVGAVTDATIFASETAFKSVQNDAGFREAVQMIVALGLAASEKDPIAVMADHGVNIPKNATVIDVAIALRQGLEKKISESGKRSDFGQKAGDALAAAVIEHMSGKLGNLFTPTEADVTNQLKGFKKPSAFGEFSRTFFGRLTTECMQYFLSKTLATNLGAGMRFTTLNQMGEFNSALETHCKESSVLVEEYSKDWFSKRRFEENGKISRKSIQGFGWYALEKMRGEFTFEGKNNGK